MRENIIVEIEVEAFYFNERLISFVYLDISHINYDRQNFRRSDLEADEIVTVLINELSDLCLKPEGVKDGYEYFV